MNDIPWKASEHGHKIFDNDGRTVADAYGHEYRGRILNAVNNHERMVHLLTKLYLASGPTNGMRQSEYDRVCDEVTAALAELKQKPIHEIAADIGQDIDAPPWLSKVVGREVEVIERLAAALTDIAERDPADTGHPTLGPLTRTISVAKQALAELERENDG